MRFFHRLCSLCGRGMFSFSKVQRWIYEILVQHRMGRRRLHEK
jgi:hypothetical protein